MIEYRVFDLLVHELDPRPRHFPDAIHATTQERPGRLAIWLVRRGRGHLPWHGVGVVEDDDKIRVAPLSAVMAQGGYAPVSLPGEGTPFFYRPTGKHPNA
ncbi:MAG: hypothetical protein WD830_03495 [Chloroflexota bacterium]